MADKPHGKPRMMQIAVQTLDGHRLEVAVDPNGTVKDLRQQLQQQHGLAKCALYFKVKSIRLKPSSSVQTVPYSPPQLLVQPAMHS